MMSESKSDQAKTTTKQVPTDKGQTSLPIAVPGMQPVIKVEVAQPPPSLLPVVVPAALVIAGWFVVNRSQGNRERRKQIRETVGELQDALTELETASIEYQTKARDLTAERSILTQLGRIEMRLNTLPRIASRRLSIPGLRAADPNRIKVSPEKIRRLRQALTLKHFGDEHTEALDHQSELVMEIIESISEVHGALEEVRISALD